MPRSVTKAVDLPVVAAREATKDEIAACLDDAKPLGDVYGAVSPDGLAVTWIGPWWDDRDSEAQWSCDAVERRNSRWKRCDNSTNGNESAADDVRSGAQSNDDCGRKERRHLFCTFAVPRGARWVLQRHPSHYVAYPVTDANQVRTAYPFWDDATTSWDWDAPTFLIDLDEDGNRIGSRNVDCD